MFSVTLYCLFTYHIELLLHSEIVFPLESFWMVDALDRHLPAGFIQASSFSTCMAASITLIGWLVNFFRRFPKKFSNVNQTPFFPETILLLPPIHKRNASPSLQFPGSYYHCKRMERNRHPVILSQDACLPSSRHLYFPFPVAQDPPLVVLPRQIKNAIADVQNCRHDKHEHQLCLGTRHATDQNSNQYKADNR